MAWMRIGHTAVPAVKGLCQLNVSIEPLRTTISGSQVRSSCTSRTYTYGIIIKIVFDLGYKVQHNGATTKGHMCSDRFATPIPQHYLQLYVSIEGQTISLSLIQRYWHFDLIGLTLDLDA